MGPSILCYGRRRRTKRRESSFFALCFAIGLFFGLLLISLRRHFDIASRRAASQHRPQSSPGCWTLWTWRAFRARSTLVEAFLNRDNIVRDHCAIMLSISCLHQLRADGRDRLDVSCGCGGCLSGERLRWCRLKHFCGDFFRSGYGCPHTRGCNREIFLDCCRLHHGRYDLSGRIGKAVFGSSLDVKRAMILGSYLPCVKNDAVVCIAHLC